MPGFLITVGATVACAHGGLAQSPAPVARVLVMGQPVVPQPPPLLVAGCANPPPPAGVGPCVTASAVTGSVRVRVMGVPVLLQDSVAVSVPSGTPMIMVPSQFRVRGV